MDDRVVANGDVNAVSLLTERRRLPATARNIVIYGRHYQGSDVHVRFDAPYEDAQTFAEELAGGTLTPGFDPWADGGMGGERPSWWPPRYPEGAAGGGSASYRGGLPPVLVMMRRRGEMATVWLETSHF